jgi:8-amino-7-oxononanoate synthase
VIKITRITDSNRIRDFLKRVKYFTKLGLNSYMLPIQNAACSKVRVDDKELLMLGSYSYLGLITHPEIIKVGHEALDKYGVGAGGVRLLTGTTDMHHELERKISEFKRTEEAMVLSSGYVTNMTLISTLFGKDDLIIIDKYDHQSIYDGCILSRAEWKRFNHNDMDDLARVLEEHRENYKRVIIVVDGVYSMDGDIAPMPEIIELAKQHNAFTMVDEAHSIGTIGPSGRGIDDYFGLEPGAIDIYMGTLSKAIPSIGGYIAANKEVITYLKYNSNAFIFSAALPPVSAAVALKALEIIETDIDRIRTLQKNYTHFIEGVKALGFDTLRSKDTPIVPVIIGGEVKTFRFAKQMRKAGILVPPIVFPAVPQDAGRLRCCVMATHTEEEINYILNTMERIGKDLKVI